jgi:hypothetical protein
VTRRYDFYLRVVKTIFYERAQRVSKILFLTREDKGHIFKPPCNVLNLGAGQPILTCFKGVGLFIVLV